MKLIIYFRLFLCVGWLVILFTISVVVMFTLSTSNRLLLLLQPIIYFLMIYLVLFEGLFYLFFFCNSSFCFYITKTKEKKNRENNNKKQKIMEKFVEITFRLSTNRKCHHHKFFTTALAQTNEAYSRPPSLIAYLSLFCNNFSL